MVSDGQPVSRLRRVRPQGLRPECRNHQRVDFASTSSPHQRCGGGSTACGALLPGAHESAVRAEKLSFYPVLLKNPCGCPVQRTYDLGPLRETTTPSLPALPGPGLPYITGIREKEGLSAFFGKYFLLVCDLSSYSLNTVFHRAEVFNFNQVQLINSFFHVLSL